MDNKGNPKSDIVNHAINILEQPDAHTVTRKPKSVTVSDKINILEKADAHENMLNRHQVESFSVHTKAHCEEP
jgi:hypothetical protein